MNDEKSIESARLEAVKRANELFEQLTSLDFNNLEAVLDWTLEFKKASEESGGFPGKVEVTKIFASHGFGVGVNTGKDFDAENKENFAKYIVGQALEGFGSAGIERFIGDWKKKFSSGK